jgi:hypothetical protein
VDADGSFLDVGCSSGHLMECLQLWAAEDGITLEPWGLDIRPSWLRSLAIGCLVIDAPR